MRPHKEKQAIGSETEDGGRLPSQAVNSMGALVAAICMVWDRSDG